MTKFGDEVIWFTLEHSVFLVVIHILTVYLITAGIGAIVAEQAIVEVLVMFSDRTWLELWAGFELRLSRKSRKKWLFCIFIVVVTVAGGG